MSEGKKQSANDDSNLVRERSWRQSEKPNQGKEVAKELWGIFLFGLIGATVTTFAVGQLRKTVDWFAQLTRSDALKKGATGSYFRANFREEAWKSYNRRMQEEYEEEMERVERIKRMQNVFNRERNKFRRGYESWKENSSDGYHQHFQREDWYWKTDTSYRDHTRFKESPTHSTTHTLSHHYAVLGLSRSRTIPYTDDEIKTAFRAKAKEFHPDQNQTNKEVAEAKFKEVMTSYEAIKSERKNMK